MSQLPPPGSAVYRRFPVARGRGIHADEADSAVAAISRMITRGTASELAEEGGFENADAPDTAVRSNPGVTVMSYAELFPIAMLTTGQWGPGGTGGLYESVVPATRLRMNPSPKRGELSGDFTSRMVRLQDEVAAALVRVEKRYNQNGAAKTEASRPWAKVLNLLLRAVGHVLSQDGKRGASILSGGLPFGITWGVVAGKGNKKLPFAAYSELPMATCPGAGKCGVPFGAYDRSEDRAEKSAKGAPPKDGSRYCYSFKAFRYPSAFARQFLNTLANYADREFAIQAAGGPADPRQYDARVQAALRGSQQGARQWPTYVRNLVLAVAEGAISNGKTSFLRLFVDGDINFEDCVVEWMRVCHQIAPGTALGGKPGIEVYGYSKCWKQFVNVDSSLRTAAERAAGAYGAWPKNYTLNMSTDSIYAERSPKAGAFRAATERLPITRWYFEGIPLKAFIAQLNEQAQLFKELGTVRVSLPDVAEQPFEFSAERIEQFVAINALSTVAEAQRVFPKIAWGKKPPATPQGVRTAAYRYYWSKVLTDPKFGAVVRGELLKDKAAGGDTVGAEAPGKVADEDAYLAGREAKMRAKLKAITEAKRAGKDVSRQERVNKKFIEAKKQGPEAFRAAVQEASFSKKALHDKALALVLHETFWSLGIGGSCPLVCGNCSDVVNPSPENPGVHRCASKVSFKGKTIHIGIH